MNYDEMRARITRAAAMGETVGARVNPDGSYDVIVSEANDLDRARTKRAAKGKRWRGVTNELVTSHANPDCEECKGTGESEVENVCGCAETLFQTAYRGRMRWNQSKHRLEVFV